MTPKPADNDKNTKVNHNKKRHSLRYVVLAVVFVAFLVYAVYAIANINMQIADKQAEYDSLQSQIQIQEIKNSELEHVLNYSDEEYLDYVIRKAHTDLDYVRQGERVFVNSSGN